MKIIWTVFIGVTAQAQASTVTPFDELGAAMGKLFFLVAIPFITLYGTYQGIQVLREVLNRSRRKRRSRRKGNFSAPRLGKWAESSRGRRHHFWWKERLAG